MEPLRVLQIVDSLTIGGAESVALNLANDISSLPGYKAFLVCTREEGPLKERIDNKVSYLFLNKKKTLDLAAIKKLHQFIVANKIQIIHAHSTSFLYPVLLKLFCNYKIVWHDHYGLEIGPNGKRIYKYIPFSRLFNYAISVNEKLLASNIKYLHLSSVKQAYIPNYSVAQSADAANELKLIGVDSHRIVCLANLRPQKDHENLLHAFKIIHKNEPLATLYCLGICMGDAYEHKIRSLIESLGLSNVVVLTGGVANPFIYLKRAAVGVLSSKSEGLPLSLIEYGLAGLPVVCTNVGQCADLLDNGNNGLLVPAGDSNELAAAVLKYFNNENLKLHLLSKLRSFIRNNYSKEAILQKIDSIYKLLLK
jgi:glycosyltransferase involved in cell wall biosynthesis